MSSKVVSFISGACLIAGGLFVGACAPRNAPLPEGDQSSAQAALTSTHSAAQLILRAPWGVDDGQLGRSLPEEAAPEGPMSFAVAADGSIYVLDQVNLRVQVFKAGAHVRNLQLEADTYQDIAVVEGRGLVLLDRLAQRHLRFVDWAGRSLSVVPLEGSQVPEGGGVSAMFVRPDGVWVEVEHRQLVRVATLQGQAATERLVRTGRFTESGKPHYTAARDGLDGAVVMRHAGGADAVASASQIRFDLPVLYLFALEQDRVGRVYLAAHLTRYAGPPDFEPVEEREELVVLNAAGRLQQRIALQANSGPEEQFQSLRVTPDGAVYHLVLDDLGASLWGVMP